MKIENGLWKKKSKTGLAYYSGYKKLDDGREVIITLFNNKKKTNDKQPDLNIIIEIKDGTEKKDEADKDPFDDFAVEKGQELTDAERKELKESSLDTL